MTLHNLEVSKPEASQTPFTSYKCSKLVFNSQEDLARTYPEGVSRGATRRQDAGEQGAGVGDLIFLPAEDLKTRQLKSFSII